MVHLKTLNAMRKYYDEHLKEWVKERPGQYVLLEGSGNNPEVSFYKTEDELREATSKYQGIYGGTHFDDYIPKRYRRPDSLLTLEERSVEVHRDTIKRLRNLDELEERSRKSTLILN